MDEIDHLNAIMEIARKRAIEECARVVETGEYWGMGASVAIAHAIAAIRALKDKKK